MLRNIYNRYFLYLQKILRKYKLRENSKVYNVVSLNDKKLYTCKEYINHKNQVKREETILNMIETNNHITKYYTTIIEEDRTYY